MSFRADDDWAALEKNFFCINKGPYKGPEEEDKETKRWMMAEKQVQMMGILYLSMYRIKIEAKSSRHEVTH